MFDVFLGVNIFALPLYPLPTVPPQMNYDWNQFNSVPLQDMASKLEGLLPSFLRLHLPLLWAQRDLDDPIAQFFPNYILAFGPYFFKNLVMA